MVGGGAWSTRLAGPVFEEPSDATIPVPAAAEKKYMKCHLTADEDKESAARQPHQRHHLFQVKFKISPILHQLS